MNAIVHADYAQQGAPIRIALFDDRIEIENPGLLPFGLTIEDIMQGVSKLRNRVIGRVFHELHLIEQWGSGIQRMTAACQEAGLEGSQTGRNRDAFSRDHFQRAGEATPYGRDGPAHPRFVQRWRCPVDGGCSEARWTLPASHSDTVEVDDVPPSGWHESRRGGFRCGDSIEQVRRALPGCVSHVDGACATPARYSRQNRAADRRCAPRSRRSHRIGVLSVKQKSARCRLLGGDRTFTFRAGRLWDLGSVMK